MLKIKQKNIYKKCKKIKNKKKKKIKKDLKNESLLIFIIFLY